MAKKRYLFFDIDGTLAAGGYGNTYIPESTKIALEKLRQAGHFLCICTGRAQALAVSFPTLLEAMTEKFLSCTTADGYNPYRVTKAGFDWETEDPADPWSYIGYWGDHQIIYLLRLMEAEEAHAPGHLAARLDTPAYPFANVPYRIKRYQEILKNPKDTICFDAPLSDRLKKEMAAKGVDARADGKRGI